MFSLATNASSQKDSAATQTSMSTDYLQKSKCATQRKIGVDLKPGTKK